MVPISNLGNVLVENLVTLKKIPKNLRNPTKIEKRSKIKKNPKKSWEIKNQTNKNNIIKNSVEKKNKKCQKWYKIWNVDSITIAMKRKELNGGIYFHSARPLGQAESWY